MLIAQSLCTCVCVYVCVCVCVCVWSKQMLLVADPTERDQLTFQLYVLLTFWQHAFTLPISGIMYCVTNPSLRTRHTPPVLKRTICDSIPQIEIEIILSEAAPASQPDDYPVKHKYSKYNQHYVEDVPFWREMKENF